MIKESDGVKIQVSVSQGLITIRCFPRLGYFSKLGFNLILLFHLPMRILSMQGFPRQSYLDTGRYPV